ncbi:MAG: nucleotidyltransferase domain-containing protein [Spirochaetales bacterium]|nr:nucleotidyltransferase domain-containing protein [Spirochaetales bacterium]
MKELESYIPGIVNSLRTIDPYKIIMFGSVASGLTNESSDIDLAVIINKDDLPQSYDEKLDNSLLVRDAILDISFEVPIDLLVYTRREFMELESNNKPFFSEIVDKGRVLYEKAC